MRYGSNKTHRGKGLWTEGILGGIHFGVLEPFFPLGTPFLDLELGRKEVSGPGQENSLGIPVLGLAKAFLQEVGGKKFGRLTIWAVYGNLDKFSFLSGLYLACTVY